MKWDDVRIFLAVARGGSPIAAGNAAMSPPWRGMSKNWSGDSAALFCAAATAMRCPMRDWR